eukprot:gene6562-6790_t
MGFERLLLLTQAAEYSYAYSLQQGLLFRLRLQAEGRTQLLQQRHLQAHLLTRRHPITGAGAQ